MKWSEAKPSQKQNKTIGYQNDKNLLEFFLFLTALHPQN